MRRLFSILLLLVFGLPFASPLFALASGADASVPVCCRRDGKHHCTRSSADRESAASVDARFAAPPERCPFAPAAVSAVHTTVLAAAGSAASAFSPAASDPNGLIQTESKRRIARDRSRQKRGPPALAGVWSLAGSTRL